MNTKQIFVYAEVGDFSFEAEWTGLDGQSHHVSMHQAEIVRLMHENIETGHELIGIYHDTLNNRYVRINQDGAIKTVDLAYYTQKNVRRLQSKLIPILEKELAGEECAEWLEAA